MDSTHRHNLGFYAGELAAVLVIGFTLAAILHGDPVQIMSRFALWLLVLNVVESLVGVIWRKVRRQSPAPNLPEVQEALLAELHRRQTRYDSGEITSPDAQLNVAGELLGLRVAVGVAHGYEAATPQAPQEAMRLYGEWLARQERAGKSVSAR